MQKITYYDPAFGVQTIEGDIVEQNEKWIFLDTGEEHFKIARKNIIANLPLKK